MASQSSKASTAKLAVDILTDLSGRTDFFFGNWTAFNAFYNDYVGTDRDRLMECVRDGLSDADARQILSDVERELTFYSSLPPGDMRFPRQDPKFRKNTTRDLTNANDDTLPPGERLAYLMSSVYQVRCNLFHGSKNPTKPRSRQLIADGATIVAAVVHGLLKNVDEIDRDELDRHFEDVNRRWTRIAG